MNFSKIVVSRLFELKMTKKTLSELTGISYSYLNNLIGGRKRWNEEIMNKACKVLNIKIEFKEVS